MNIFVGIVVTLSLHNLIGNCYQMDIDIPVFMQRWILPITKFINPDLASPQEFGTTQTQGGFNDNMDFHRNITFNAGMYILSQLNKHFWLNFFI
ncbi:unnamed protein product [Allacma fusca]|uniref:Secreted protein n=1 Tax=Allacma fusca TaxID=39272 RepID=A0A8J2JYJ0_9HEXA|nr:unnamed protein product [Allacma fusca]